MRKRDIPKTFPEQVRRWHKLVEDNDNKFCTKDDAPDNVDEAWDKTFAKWFWIASGFETDYDRTTCGLCNLYNSLSTKVICRGCPIKEYVGFSACLNTPACTLGFSMKDAFQVLREISFLCKVARDYYQGEQALQKHKKHKKNYPQVCIWEGINPENFSFKWFTDKMKKDFDVRIICLEVIETRPEIRSARVVEGTGGRFDLFFSVHKQDVDSFNEPKTQYTMKWVDDEISPAENYKYQPYPERVKRYRLNFIE